MNELNLFDIERTLVELADQWQEADTPEAIEAAETAIRVYVEAEIRKVDGIRKYVRFCDTQAGAAKAEAALQRARQAAWESRRDRLRQFVYDVMTSFRVRKLEGSTGALQIKSNGGKLPLCIVSETLVPDEYSDVTVTMTVRAWQSLIERGIPVDSVTAAPFKVVRAISNERVRAALEAGDGVPGARLGDRGEHLEIK